MDLAADITEELTIPTIGIGAGRDCDGQILVLHDVLGLFDEFTPKFAKRYAELGQAAREAIATYVDEVRAESFPDAAHSYLLRAEQGGSEGAGAKRRRAAAG